MAKVTKRFQSSSGHWMIVVPVSREELPANLSDHTVPYSKFYAVRNGSPDGHTFLYLGKGHEKYGDKEIVAWYPRTGAFWASYGTNLETAVNGAIRDGWMYA